MADYYLISQLPSLDCLSDEMAVPISEERFFELCGRFLKGKVLEKIKKLTLLPSLNADESDTGLIRAWNEKERGLRLALARLRAERMNKSFCVDGDNVPSDVLRAASAAVEMTDPMEAERFLLKYRLQLLEELRPTEHFCEDYLFYYGLKLKLISRVRGFDGAQGRAVYQSIYKSVMEKDRLETENE